MLKEGRFEYPKSGMRELRAVPADVNKGIGEGGILFYEPSASLCCGL